MLSSSNQYLNPEYIQPLPTTLDAKKSPLAMLAATCNNIGKDTPPKLSPVRSVVAGEKRAAVEDKRSPPEISRKLPKLEKIGSPVKRSTPEPKDRQKDTETGQRTSSQISLSCGNMFVEVKHREDATGSNPTEETNRNQSPNAKKVSLSSLSSDSRGEIRREKSITSSSSSHVHNGLSPLSAFSAGSYPLPVPHSSSAAAAAAAHAAGLSSSLDPYLSLAMAHSSPLKPDLFGSPTAAAAAAAAASLSAAAAAAPSLLPYLYGSTSSSVPGGGSVPCFCRDPACLSAQIMAHNAQLALASAAGSVCPSGCKQCSAEKAVSALKPHLKSPSHGSANGLSSQHLATLSSSNSHSFVCNWILGNDCCNKRFPSADELLHHLRSHTATANETVRSSIVSPGSGTASTSMPPCHSHLTSSLTNSASDVLRRAYPSSLSPPLSRLLLKPPTAHSDIPSLGLPTHPLYSHFAALGSLYGHRIGAI